MSFFERGVCVCVWRERDGGLIGESRFSAFDEPWKVRFNEEGKEWEDKWGLMDVDRNLKEGLVIPDC